MNDLQSLLSAIPSNPDVAFVLADYLEEMDDPRCQLLRLTYTLRNQIELDGLRWQNEVRLRELVTSGPEPIVPTYTDPTGMKFRYIPPGHFRMGGLYEGEWPVHPVRISHGFFLATTPVTQGQWQQIMGHDPSFFQGHPDLPVDNVSWIEGQEFCWQLQEETGLPIRLPTEAEWEYACRAGTTTKYCHGDSDLDAVGWHYANSQQRTHPVGQKRPNAFGLYDMHGNVYEWCEDWHGDYLDLDLTDPQGPPRGEYRILRGGSWEYFGHVCRSAARYENLPEKRLPTFGIRVCFDAAALV